MGFTQALIDQKTSLKMRCILNHYLATEYDNIFIDSNVFKRLSSGANSIYKSFTVKVSQIYIRLPPCLD